MFEIYANLFPFSSPKSERAKNKFTIFLNFQHFPVIKKGSVLPQQNRHPLTSTATSHFQTNTINILYMPCTMKIHLLKVVGQIPLQARWGSSLLVVEPVRCLNFFFTTVSKLLSSTVCGTSNEAQGRLCTSTQKMSALTRLYRKYSTNHINKTPSTINLHACTVFRIYINIYIKMGGMQKQKQNKIFALDGYTVLCLKTIFTVIYIFKKKYQFGNRRCFVKFSLSQAVTNSHFSCLLEYTSP